jgi:uncharacterized protein (TIGR02284 family)
MASHQQGLEQLNSFLRGELSAVETYRQALEKFDDEPQVASQLRTCLESHEQRASFLRSQIQALGGQPASDAGTWGAFAKLVQGGAKIFGKKAAIAALEEGEDHGRNDYQRDLDDLPVQLRTMIQTKLLPEQMRTHDTVSALKHNIS